MEPARSVREAQSAPPAERAATAHPATPSERTAPANPTTTAEGAASARTATATERNAPARTARTRRPDRRMLAAKTVLWLLCLTPAALLVYRAMTGGLGANPIEFITLKTGFWTLALLMVTLAVTPVRRITGWNRLVQLRRPLGLFAFFYATLHFLTYVTLDRFFDFSGVYEDIMKRPYITVGFAAFLLLIPLALTSTKGWIRRLGKRWQLLHRLIYLCGALGVLHFYWKKSAKADIFEPILFAGILGTLLLIRVFLTLRRRARA